MSDEKVDVRAELNILEQSIADLKIAYEQYFLGLLPFAPEQQHKQLKRLIRELRKAPFKSSAMKYRLRTLETRYNTYNTYWQRVLREKEEGTYHRDVFKANLRQQQALEDARSLTARGKAERSMVELFKSYKTALEQQTGRHQNLDYDAFRQSLVKRAKEFKEKNGAKRLTFKVAVRDGKVSVQATAKG